MLALFRDLFSPPRHMILLVIAAWIGLTLAEKRAERYGVAKEDLNNLTFYGLIAFILGGRMAYALENLSAFSKSPLGVFSINPDLFDPLGGLAVALVTALIYGQRRNLPLWPTLDAVTPFFAVLAVGLGLSHLAAGTAFGKPTDLAWGIDLWSAKRHPTQIYETIASLLTLGLIWTYKPGSRAGLAFLTFAAVTAGWNLFLSALRGDSTIVFNGLRQEQLLAWVVLAISLIGLERLTNTSVGKNN